MSYVSSSGHGFLISPFPGGGGAINPGGSQGGDRGNLFDHLPRPERAVWVISSLVMLSAVSSRPIRGPVCGCREAEEAERRQRSWR